jgi:hypothetical protein
MVAPKRALQASRLFVANAMEYAWCYSSLVGQNTSSRDVGLTTPSLKSSMKNLSILFIAMSALLVTGCGGSGSAEVSTAAPQFIVWAGSSGGSQVIDGPGHLFAYNVQTGQENTAFCLAAGSNFVSYGAFHGQVANVLVSNGTCQAAIIDSLTGNFSDIEVDAYGREVVLTTPLHPALCLP